MLSCVSHSLTEEARVMSLGIEGAGGGEGVREGRGGEEDAHPLAPVHDCRHRKLCVVPQARAPTGQCGIPED